MASDGENQQAQQNAEPAKEEVEVKKEETKEEVKEEPKKAEKESKKEEGKEKKEEKKKEKEEVKKEPAPPKPTVHKADFRPDVVYVYQFSRTPVIPSMSPFCLKVETWLRINQIQYENVDHKMSLRSKRGQLPFVELNGEEIADSGIIIEELTKRFNKNLDEKLTPEQRCLSHTTISMIENELFWVLYWWRCKNPERFLKGTKWNVQQALGSKVPNSILNFMFKLRFRRGVNKVKAQGMGVHKPEEIEEKGRRDIQVLSDLLADKEYFFGTEPTLVDVVAFSVLSQFTCFDPEVPFPLRTWIEQNTANLISFVDRMKEKCYPDWEEMLKNLDLNSHLPKEKKEEPAEEKTEEKKEVAEKTEEVKEEAKANGEKEEKKAE